MSKANKDDKTEYRNLLIQTEQKSQESYDKAVLTLSAGALGISLAFTKDIIGSGEIASKCFLLYSWICWTLSISFILVSFFTSISVCRHAIKQHDRDGQDAKKLGGFYDMLTYRLNILGGLLFLVGIGFMITFAFKNI